MLAASFECLNSSLAQSASKLWCCKVTVKKWLTWVSTRQKQCGTKGVMNSHLHFLYDAQFHELCKSNENLRPIAVGFTYRCMAAKVCLRPYIPRIQ